MLFMVSYYTKLKPRWVCLCVWCLVCDYRCTPIPTHTHKDLPAYGRVGLALPSLRAFFLDSLFKIFF